MHGMEFKSFRLDLKEGGVDEQGRFEGYAAVFGNLDLNGDVIEPGALTKTLEETGGELPILYQHNPYEVIGLGKFDQDKKGMPVRGQLNMDVQRARETRSLVQQRAIKGLSIGYRAVKADREPNPHGGPLRTIRRLKEIRLFEFSPVTFPANPLAGVDSIKSLLALTPDAEKNEVAELFLQALIAEDELKAGRVLSGINADKIRAAISSGRAAITVLEALLNDATGGAGKGAADMSDEPDDSTRRALLDAVAEAKAVAEIRGLASRL